jgi:hypothetical protein
MSVRLFSKQSLGLTQKAITRLSAPQLLLNQMVASDIDSGSYSLVDLPLIALLE